MKVVCDNCRAVYKVPNEKLVKAVNKATCRNCRYRMLIPRPNPGTDPDERVLVSAVPPSDSSIPGRREPSVPIGTSPTSSVTVQSSSLPPAPGPGAGSLPPRSRPIRMPGDPAPAPERPYSRPPGPASRPPGPISRPPGPISRPPGPSSWPPSPDPRVTPPPQAPSPQRVEAMPAPTPLPASRVSSRPSVPPPGSWVSTVDAGRVSYGGPLRTHDPSGDLSWVLVGTAVSALGALVLALVAPLGSLPVVWMGGVLAVGGAALTIAILWTGARGRRKARAPLALFASIPVAVLGATGLVVVKVAGQAALDEMARMRTEETELEPLDIEVPGTPDAAPAAATTDPIPEPETVPVPPPRPEPAPAKAATTARPAPTPVPAPAPAPAPTRPTLLPPPPPAPDPLPARNVSDLPESVSGEVVRFMLGDYRQAKACFVPLARDDMLPSRVDTRFKIMPDGTPQDFEVTAPDVHTSGELERCLRRAVTTLQFPESALGAKVDYPFILK